MRTKKTKPLSEAQLEQRRNAGRQKKTLSDEALQQRREASELARAEATGPKTEEGKTASSRNAWKTGAHSAANGHATWFTLGAVGKPCKSTCKHYPCTLVEDGQTKPGQDCLDKTVYVEAFDAIMAGLHHGDTVYTQGLLASQIAGAISLLQDMRDHIASEGMVIVKPFITKDGQAIYDTDGKPLGEPILNPVVVQYTKLLDKLGLNLPELMLTPRAVAKAEEPEEQTDRLLDAFARAATVANTHAPKAAPVRPAIDGEAKIVDD